MDGRRQVEVVVMYASSRSHLPINNDHGIFRHGLTPVESESLNNDVDMLSRTPCHVAKQAFCRSLATRANNLPSSSYTQTSTSNESATQTTPQDLSTAEREMLEAALRVDQAGEIAANYIYQGQMAVLGRDKAMGPLISVSFKTWCPFRLICS